MKRLLTFVIWVIAGGLLAVIGQTAWNHYSREKPAEAQALGDQLRAGMEKGRDVVSRAADEVRKVTADESVETNALPAEETAVASTDSITAERTETDVNDRLYRLAEGEDRAKNDPSEQVAATSVPAEIERQRRQEAIIRRQLQIVDDLYSKD